MRISSRLVPIALGLAFATAARAEAAAPTVANGSFESPGVTGSAVYTAPASMAGWTVSAGSVTLADASVWAPANGLQSIQFGQNAIRASSTLRQVIAVEAQHRYRLTFSYADGPTAPASYTACGSIPGIVMPLTVSWDGAVVATVRWSGGHLTDDWQHFSTLVTAAGNSAALQFSSAPEDDFQACFMNLDDVALSTPTAAETSTRLTASANPSVSGQPVAFTATVIGGDPQTTPTGSVQFSVDGTPAGGPHPLDSAGRATLTSSSIATGAHTMTAGYLPTSGSAFQPSQAEPLSQTVNSATTTVVVSVSPSVLTAGQSATLSASVAALAPGGGTPTGTLQFAAADGTPIGTPQTLSGGTASVPTTLGAGTRVIRADYRGDANFGASTGSLRQSVRRADTTTTISSDTNPVIPGGTVTFDVTVASLAPGRVVPRGTIYIIIDGEDLSGPVPLFEDGPAQSNVEITFRAPTTPGDDTIAATYSGDADTNPSTSASYVQVVSAPPAAHVSSPAAVVTATPPPAATVAPPPPPPPATAAALEAMSAPLVRALKRKGITALRRERLPFTATAPGTLSLRVTSHSRLLASAGHAFSAPGASVVTLRLAAAGRRSLRHPRPMALTIVTRFVPTDGPPVNAISRLTTKAHGALSTATGRFLMTSSVAGNRRTRLAVAR
jgi:hypothetical protein